LSKRVAEFGNYKYKQSLKLGKNKKLAKHINLARNLENLMLLQYQVVRLTPQVVVDSSEIYPTQVHS
jgi:hypothetical protein